MTFIVGFEIKEEDLEKMPKVTPKRFRNMRYKPYVAKKTKKSRSKTDVLLASNPTLGLSRTRAIYGFPTNVTTTLRYADVVTLSPGGVVSKHVFSMNSLFDPDVTATGHQPFFYDQLTTQYNKYVVLGAKLTAQFMRRKIMATTSTGTLVVGTVGDNNGTTSGTLSTLMELNTGNSMLMPIQDGGPSSVVLYQFYSPEKSLGIDREDDTVSALVTASPSKQWYATVWAQDTGDDLGSVSVKVQIEYTVRFYEPVEPTGS